MSNATNLLPPDAVFKGMKKRKTSRNQSSKNAKVVEKKHQANTTEIIQESRGVGLPDIDLKKMLGCGG